MSSEGLSEERAIGETRKARLDLRSGKKDPFIQDVIRRNFHSTFFFNMIELLLLCYIIVRVG